MQPPNNIFDIDLSDFCHRWKITTLALFGSVLTPEFNEKSDIDVLVEFSDSAHWTLFDLVHMRDELKALFGREVDLVSKRGIEKSANHIRREHILSTARPLYAER